ncbi:extracellular solute-binding protein [Bacillus sp. SD088]|uniref:extracellular solute-binding protein n=1 Tax=Bacillus sp. SD088 TaxID=2782012 RepID=UPI001A97484F|nr:extracellular solute-binding protein [Bacillus sp. SD088]MBO0991823.1 extracellular solute-binding protein [Bacillus sp. SD088]
MKIKKGALLLMLSFFLILAACSGKKSSPQTPEINEEDLENLNESGMPIVNNPITIKFMAGKPSTNADDYNDVLLWQTYEEMTNIHIDWDLVDSEARDEKRNLTLSGDTLPDVFYTMYMPNHDLLKYGQQGIFVKLNDLIEEYMPNLSELLEQYPAIRKGITFPDGNIYGLPTIYDPEFTSLILGSKAWIRQDWLDQLDMEMPETIDDFYDYLKAVKETDLNGNGEQDEIPYGATSIEGLRDILRGAFGIGNRGVKHAYLDEDPDTQELRFYPTSDGYKAELEYLHKLYSEKLIGQNIYTIETSQSNAEGAEGLYGSTVLTSPEAAYGEEMGKEFVGLSALEGPAGKSYHRATPPLAHMGGFVVTNENEHIPATLRWMDYFYSEEGAKLFFMGVEGETYEEDEDGELQYVDKIANSADGLSLNQELSKYMTWLGGGYPGIVRSETFKGSENMPSSNEAADRLEPYMLDTEDIWPSFTYSIEENNQLSGLEVDIHKYVDEMQDKFITGSEPFSKWDEYIERLEKMGLEEYMDIQEKAYERYKNN